MDGGEGGKERVKKEKEKTPADAEVGEEQREGSNNG